MHQGTLGTGKPTSFQNADRGRPEIREEARPRVADVLDEGVKALDDQRDEVVLEGVGRDDGPSAVVPAPVRTSQKFGVLFKRVRAKKKSFCPDSP